jgi:hypothetical protein
LVLACLLAGLLFAGVAATGCGDSNKSAAPTTTAAGEAGEGGEAGEAGEAGESGEAGATGEAGKKVPRVLGEAESGAEDIVDFARARNRAKVVATAHELRNVAEGRAASALRSAGVPEKRIAALTSRARRVDDLAENGNFLAISLAANQVSGLMPEFYGRYSDPVPPEVLELDYLDREAQLRSKAGESKAVVRAVLALVSTWAGLKSRVVAAGGDKAAADFSRHVESIGRLARRSDRVALQKEASRGLELVDVLEGVFQK